MRTCPKRAWTGMFDGNIFPYRRDRATKTSSPWHAGHWADNDWVKYIFGLRTWCLRGAYMSQNWALTGNDGHVRWHIFPYRRDRATTASCPWHGTHWVDMARVKYFWIAYLVLTWCLRVPKTGFDGQRRACSVAISSPTGGIGLLQQVAHGMPHIGLTWLG